MAEHFHVFFAEPIGKIDSLRTRKDCAFATRSHANSWVRRQRSRGRFLVRACDGSENAGCPFPDFDPDHRYEANERRALPAAPRQRKRRPVKAARDIIAYVRTLDRAELRALAQWLQERDSSAV